MTGKKVLVKHTVRSGKVTQAKPKIYDLVHQYLGGNVRVSSGDVWAVKPVSHAQYDFVTVAAVES